MDVEDAPSPPTCLTSLSFENLMDGQEYSSGMILRESNCPQTSQEIESFRNLVGTLCIWVLARVRVFRPVLSNRGQFFNAGWPRQKGARCKSNQLTPRCKSNQLTPRCKSNQLTPRCKSNQLKGARCKSNQLTQRQFTRMLSLPPSLPPSLHPY